MTASARSKLGTLGLVVMLVAAFAFVPRVFAQKSRGMMGTEAPDFELPLVANAEGLGQGQVEGAPVKLSALRGNAVLLDFWATWCAPCRAEAPIVDQVWRRWKDKGLVVVGVNTDTPDQGDPRRFALSHGLTYPIVHDLEGLASRLFGVDSLPTLVVVSRAGNVIAVRTGITGDAELERLVRQAL
jgi:cytochrome c biogenesis protein CcmG/thiol:disulfide interchange protein DsbE